MAARILSLILGLSIVWCLILTVNADCNQTYDDSTCEYNMYCENEFQKLHYWDYYARDEYQTHSSFCTPSHININGRFIKPITLVYKDVYYNEDPYTQLPKCHEHFDTFQIIISLDISNNFFFRLPIIRSMENLDTINLSNNFIDNLKLTNANELPSLKYINLSHNRIRILQKSKKYEELPLGKLENINLSYNDMLEVPDAVFESFSNLTVLDLSYNFISVLGQMSFEGVKQLIHLNISHNNLSDINGSLFRFTELKTLDLSENMLRNVRANDFYALTALTVLNLKSNLIKSVDKESFFNLRNIHSFDISDNELEVLDQDTFKNNDNLKKIMIAKNKLKTLPKTIFKGKSIELFSIVENNLEGSIKRGMFEGLQNVIELDLSNQRLDFIEDNAFYGVGQLETLLLQNNNIKILSRKCFNMLSNLKQLDLSNNKLINIEFEKDRLGNLESLSIGNNFLTVIKHEHFQGLDSLQFLDLSNNKISHLESNSFKSLKSLTSFEISNNPLNGTLEENTFEGLNSLPGLDISCSFLTTIKNGSFNRMVILNNLNISYSKIQTLEFNSFIHTGALVTLDLSHNNIKEFIVNNTHISKLDILYLNNNHIKTLDAQTFDQMLLLTGLSVSYNEIENIDSSTFLNLKDLSTLDVSYNPNLLFNMLLLNNTSKLSELFLSGTKTGMTFQDTGNTPLLLIKIANNGVKNITKLKLNGLKHLTNLDLNHNQIYRVDFACFANISNLYTLDLSYNQITYIQPGVLKDNTKLNSLNISHNYLTTINYGIFRGPSFLQTLDISYNKIDNLQNERFYELKRLSYLIADYNRIETIDTADFLGSDFKELSIGDNPIPCNLLINLRKSKVPFKITAINLVDDNHENSEGVTCNKNKYDHNKDPGITSVTVDNENMEAILMNIRDILFNKLGSNDHVVTKSKDEESLANISRQIEKTNYENQIQLSNLTKLASQIANKNDTNILLEKILKVLSISPLKRPTTSAPITKNNATYDNIVNYMNNLKQQLEDTIAFEKNNILNEVDVKLSAIKDRTAPEPVHNELSAGSSDSKPIFTETCVALILLILVCLVLYKFYRSGLFMRKRLSISTRDLPDAMDSAL